jgi:transcriptional regulator with XRE-family HTH domain
MKSRPRALSPVAREATRLLGANIRLARRQRRWTLQELAERVGVTAVTMRKVESGDPSVRLGIAFEAAALTGVALFDEDRARRRGEAARVEDRLAVLPQRVRRPTEVDDDF